MLEAIQRFFRNAPRVVPGPVRLPGWESMLDFAIAAGPVLLELRQPPPGRDRWQGESLAVQALTPAPAPRPFTVTTDPQTAGHPKTRLVITWNPAPSLSPAALAEGHLESTTDSAPPIRLLAVLADGPTVLASAEGWIGDADDNALQHLLRQTVQHIIDPPRATGH